MTRQGKGEIKVRIGEEIEGRGTTKTFLGWGLLVVPVHPVKKTRCMAIEDGASLPVPSDCIPHRRYSQHVLHTLREFHPRVQMPPPLPTTLSKESSKSLEVIFQHYAGSYSRKFRACSSSLTGAHI